MYYFYVVHFDHLGLVEFCFYSIFTENSILALKVFNSLNFHYSFSGAESASLFYRETTT